MRTRICELLGIAHPIIQASMAWVTNADMVAAVCNAGGMGTLGPNAGAKTVTRDPLETAERLRLQIHKVREFTPNPFAVNIVVPGPGEEDFTEQSIRVVIEEAVPVVIVSQGNPKIFTERLKNAGPKVLHVVANIKHAVKAEQAGVDAVITSGTEGGGHSGFDQLTTFALVPQVVDAVKVPVVVGGGVGDHRGLMAALSLGGDGVYMGTRFMATKECPAHDNWKQALLKAAATDTVTIGHGRVSADKVTDIQGELRFGSLRLLVNEYTEQMLKAEAAGRGPDEILSLYLSPPPGYPEGISRTVAGAIYGDTVQGGCAGGQEVGLIKDMPTCKELIERIVSDAQKSIGRLSAMFPS